MKTIIVLCTHAVKTEGEKFVLVEHNEQGAKCPGERIAGAWRLYEMLRKDRTPVSILLVGHDHEVQCYREILELHGVDGTHIFEEYTHRNSIGNLQAIKQRFEAGTLEKQSVIVTNGYHRFRIRKLLQHSSIRLPLPVRGAEDILLSCARSNRERWRLRLHFWKRNCHPRYIWRVYNEVKGVFALMTGQYVPKNNDAPTMKKED